MTIHWLSFGIGALAGAGVLTVGYLLFLRFFLVIG